MILSGSMDQWIFTTYSIKIEMVTTFFTCQEKSCGTLCIMHSVSKKDYIKINIIISNIHIKVQHLYIFKFLHIHNFRGQEKDGFTSYQSVKWLMVPIIVQSESKTTNSPSI